MRNLNIDRVEQAFIWLEETFEHTAEIQSVDLLIQKLDMLNATISWAGEQMCLAKVELSKEKIKAYKDFDFTSKANGVKYPPSLAKDYVNAKCYDAEYNYDLCERLTRAIVHISENLRTSISALKQQMMLDSYTQRTPNF